MPLTYQLLCSFILPSHERFNLSCFPVTLYLQDLCGSNNASKFIDCSADRDNLNDDIFVQSRVVVAEINFVEIEDYISNKSDALHYKSCRSGPD